MASNDGKSIGRDTKAALGDLVPACGSDQSLKRIFEIPATLVILLLFAPILLITSAAIKLESSGPILIRETTRHGHRRRAIQVLKFRSVIADEGGDCGSRRLTRVGRIISQTGIDELPQLVNVLRGEISLIQALKSLL